MSPDSSATSGIPRHAPRLVLGVPLTLDRHGRTTLGSPFWNDGSGMKKLWPPPV